MLLSIYFSLSVVLYVVSVYDITKPFISVVRSFAVKNKQLAILSVDLNKSLQRL